MKKTLITTLLLLPLFIFAQNISLEQVISLRSKPLNEVSAYLTPKKWKMTEDMKPSTDFLGNIKFAFYNNDTTDTPELQIEYLYKKSSTNKNRISFKIYNESLYDNYINQLKTLGFKIQKNEDEDSEQEKIYQSNGITIKLEKRTEYSDYYSFLILSTSN